MKYNQKGFSAVEFLLIVVIIGILGGVGWYVYSQQNKDKNTDDKTFGTNAQNSAPGQAAAGTVSHSCQSSFAISIPKEWHFFNIDNGGNCAVSNLPEAEQPPTGLLSGDNVSFIFNIEEAATTLDQTVEAFFAPTEGAYPITLVSQEEIELNNGDKAIVALGEGGHYDTRENYLFYIKDNQLITTSWSADSILTETAREAIKTIE